MIKELEELIRKDRIEEFCERILNKLDELESSEKEEELITSIKKNVFILSSNLHGLLNMNRTNVIDLDQYSIGKSRIISGLLDLLKEYKSIRGETGKENLNRSPESVLISNKISEPIGLIYGQSGIFHGKMILVSSQVRKLTFGRGKNHSNSTSDVFISIDDSILSRAHFKIRINPSEDQSSSERKFDWSILDLASGNGTFVNGKQVKYNDNGRLLRHGDVIQVGDNRLQVKIFSSSTI